MNALDTFAADKEAAARLYTGYASRFTGYEPFWRRLAAGESNHAVLLRKSARSYVVPASGVHDFSGFLAKELNLADDPRLSLLHALTAAFEIEQHMAGAVLSGTPEELKKFLAGIKRDDEAHLEMVRSMMVKFS